MYRHTYSPGQQFCGLEEPGGQIIVCLEPPQCHKKHPPKRVKYQLPEHHPPPDNPEPANSSIPCALTEFAFSVSTSDEALSRNHYDTLIDGWLPPDAPFTPNTTIPRPTLQYVTRYAEWLQEPHYNGATANDMLHAAQQTLNKDHRVYTGAHPPYDHGWRLAGFGAALGYCYGAYPYYATQEATRTVTYFCGEAYAHYRAVLASHARQFLQRTRQFPAEYRNLTHELRIKRLAMYRKYCDDLTLGLLTAAYRSVARTHEGGYAKQWLTPRP